MGDTSVGRAKHNNTDLARLLLEQLWGLCVKSRSKEADLLMEYYNAKNVILDPGSACPTSHDEVLDLVSMLKTNRDETLHDLQLSVITNRQKYAWLSNQAEREVREALKFAASMWLMVATSDWSENETLPEYIQRSLPSNSLAASDMRAEFRVTARSLNHIAGIEILWSSNLKEHLKYDQNQRMLTLFRHASFLKERVSSGYPRGFLHETAATLALLFPYGESPHKRWNKRVRRGAEPDVEIGLAASASRNPQDYPYWGRHLVTIQQAFDASKPQTLRQWVYDKRDSNQFYTFWFAVIAIALTLFFGLIQSTTAVFQVIRALLSQRS